MRRKCKTPRCRKPVKPERLFCYRCLMREWRAAHPIASAWATHVTHSKERKIPVLWTREEFGIFCQNTGYHILRKDGLTIERKNALLGYSLQNCETLSHMENSTKGARFDKYVKQKFRQSCAA